MLQVKQNNYQMTQNVWWLFRFANEQIRSICSHYKAYKILAYKTKEKVFKQEF